MAETAAKKTTKKAPFGGYTVNFAGRTETPEQIFGSKPIPTTEMTKKLWAFIRSNKLSSKKE